MLQTECVRSHVKDLALYNNILDPAKKAPVSAMRQSLKVVLESMAKYSRFDSAA